MKKPITLSVFFPTYNEEDNIRATVEQALSAVQSNAYIKEYEIIIVNDGSKDRTQIIAESLARQNKRVRVINHEGNKGYGAALLSGIRAARYEYIFFTDADLQFDLYELDKLLAYIPKYEVVIGYRAPRRDPFMRLVNAKGWNVLNRLLFGLKVRDIDCAFKLFHRSALEGVKIVSRGAMISAEILIRLQRKGIVFKQVPVTHLPRVMGSPTGAKPSVILRAFRELFQLYQGELGTVSHKQAMKFGVVGVLNTLLDFFVYVALSRVIYFFYIHLVLTKTISFLVGSFSSFALNRSWTFNKKGGVSASELFRFYSTVGLSLVINAVSMHVFLNIFHMYDLAAVVLATVFTFAWNFTLSKFWVWSEEKPAIDNRTGRPVQV